jgi:hypothetical protein
MSSRRLVRLALLASLGASAAAHAQSNAYPPPREYLMSRDEELAMARSAAPPGVADRATIKVLGPDGFMDARSGDNGFTCLVMRGWSAPTYTPDQFRRFTFDATIRAPICFDPVASRVVLPYYELRSRLGMQGKAPEQITAGIEHAYATGQLPERTTASFAYMWSAAQHLGAGIGHWRPHIMVFAPYYTNAMVGGHAFGSPLPQLSDDAGTPFSVVVIPVDPSLAITPSRGRP